MNKDEAAVIIIHIILAVLVWAAVIKIGKIILGI
jgi:hypothetical protein